MSGKGGHFQEIMHEIYKFFLTKYLRNIFLNIIFLCQMVFLVGISAPQKKYLPPPPPKFSADTFPAPLPPLPRPGEPPPPPGIFSKKPTSPPSRSPPDSPFPSPEQKKSDVVRMWFGCGSDVVRTWFGRGSDVRVFSYQNGLQKSANSRIILQKCAKSAFMQYPL